MATFRRSVVPGATYFFTVNTYRRRPVLTQPSFYSALQETVRSVMSQRPFTIEAFVLLPDHLHCIWALPPNDADYATRWSMIKRGVSQKVRHLIEMPLTKSRRERGKLGLWQRRFWEHRIRDDADRERHVAYIYWNPVKHGHVVNVRDWPYSSFHRFVARGDYPLDWAGESAVFDHVQAGEFEEG